MELTQGSETSANYNLTPGKYPKEYIQYSNHGESLKSRIVNCTLKNLFRSQPEDGFMIKTKTCCCYDCSYYLLTVFISQKLCWTVKLYLFYGFLVSCHSLFAASVRSTAVRLTAFFWSTYLCEEALSQMKIIKSCRSCLTDKHVKYCRHFCLSNYEPSCSTSSKVMHCHASTTFQ